MTKDAAFKRAVRARMNLMDEPYNVARRKVLAERERESTDREGEADVGQSEP